MARAAAELVSLTAAHAGLVFENKGMTLALHYRMAPACGALAGREMRRIAAAFGDGFELQAGKFVYEIKPSGKDKGVAIAEFMAEPPFAGRVPVFIGDDLTDEQGFKLVNRIGGHSIKVGAGETAALWRIAGHAVRRWLQRYLSSWQDARIAEGAVAAWTRVIGNSSVGALNDARQDRRPACPVRQRCGFLLAVVPAEGAG